ncbi:hypothetical protein NESM_000821300 [Novymonas esmeraldas]|uniref:Uncharacterized protein n=1 Tax=Novymonas esmeraldas TaxID=1808958 RepID=A0AAW0F0A0_9TRYP
MSDVAGPRLAIPSEWVHSDLQKLRQRMEKDSVAAQLAVLDEHRRYIESQVGAVERRTTEQRARIAQLTQELQSLTSEIAPELALLEDGRRVVEGLRNQLHYQRSISKAHTPGTAAALVSTSDGSHVGTDARALEACPLSVHGLALAHGGVCSATPSRAAHAEAFLRRCAPLFQWSAEAQHVTPPFFFDEPCLLDRRTAAEAGGCHHASCPYWHRDQLAHVKMAVASCVSTLQCHSAVDEQLCAVARIASRLARQAHHADSVSVVCAAACAALQSLIVSGLHGRLLAGKQSACAMVCAPVMAARDARQAAPPRVALLRNAEELEQWRAVDQLRLSSPTPLSLSAAAVAHVRLRPSAVSWRCMLAAVEDVVSLRWLARLGVGLFPRSAELHLQYVLAVLESGAPAGEVVDVCLASCRTLSAQAAASVVAGLDCGQYATTVARHVACMLAYVLVRVSHTDAAAALALLSAVLSPDADGGVAALLLPMARQNLSLMMVALRRTGHLRRAELLPLAAVSDLALTLAPPDGANPPESGRDTLYAALTLAAAYRRDGFDAQLVGACDGALQLSVLRTFSYRLAYLERVVEKTVPQSPLSQGLVYGEYVDVVSQQQSVHAAAMVADELLRGDGVSCTLAVMLRGRLRAWGVPHLPDTSSVVTSFCELNGIAVADLADLSRIQAALERDGAVAAASPPVEWVCAYTLHALSLCGDGCDGGHSTVAAAVWARVSALPVEALAHDVDAAVAVFSILLQLCGESHSATDFRRTVHRCLVFFREVHLHCWSALETVSPPMIGLPHYLGLCIYEKVPLLLGAGAADTLAWRSVVLESAANLGVLHPLLTAE